MNVQIAPDLDAVRHLHRSVEGRCRTCINPYPEALETGEEIFSPWPCETMNALDGGPLFVFSCSQGRDAAAMGIIKDPSTYMWTRDGYGKYRREGEPKIYRLHDIPATYGFAYVGGKESAEYVGDDNLVIIRGLADSATRDDVLTILNKRYS